MTASNPVALSLRLDEATAERIRMLAFTRRCSKTDIIREALAVYLDGESGALHTPGTLLNVAGLRDDVVLLDSVTSRIVARLGGQR